MEEEPTKNIAEQEIHSFKGEQQTPSKIKVEDYLIFNTTVSFKILPATALPQTTDPVLSKLGKKLVQINVDKTNGKYGSILFSLTIDPETLDILDINDVNYKEVTESSDQDGYSSLRDMD
jgi:hypothetical protein